MGEKKVRPSLREKKVRPSLREAAQIAIGTWLDMEQCPMPMMQAMGQLESALAIVIAEPEPDCWAIMTPNGSKLVSPMEAQGRKDAYPLYTNPPDLENAFADGCKYEREAASRWIAVSEQLPPIGQPVLCFRRDAPTCGIWRRRNNEDWEWANISHWMPLPEKP